MIKKLFAELVESMTQMNEIARGERAPSRGFHVDPLAQGAALETRPFASEVRDTLPTRPPAGEGR